MTSIQLGGINSLLAMEHSGHLPLIKDTPTMILGMDVSHRGQLDIPSVAAVSPVWFCVFPCLRCFKKLLVPFYLHFCYLCSILFWCILL